MRFVLELFDFFHSIFLHLFFARIFQNKHEIDAIVSDSLSTPDPWVNEIANLVKNFRNDGSISFDSPRFCELVSDIKKIGKFLLSSSSSSPH